MKTTLLSFLLFVCISPLFSQLPNVSYEHNKGTKTITLENKNALKNVSIPGKRLDSISCLGRNAYDNMAWFLASKIKIEYTSNNQVSYSELVYFNPMDNSIMNVSIETYEFDSEGKKIAYYRNVGSDFNNYDFEEKETFTYNAQGKLFETIDYIGDASNWEVDKKTVLLYDNKGNITSVEYQYWDSYENAWISDELYEYEYNSNNLRTKESYFYFDYGVKETGWKNEYEYDGNLNNTAVYGYSWNNTDYEYSDKTIITYRTDNKISTYTLYYWETNGWLEDSQNTYLYNNQGLNIETVIKTWYNNSWTNSQKANYAYDANNNMDEMIIYDYDFLTSTWLEKTLTTNTYDNTFTFNESILPRGNILPQITYPNFNVNTSNIPLTAYFASYSNNQWVGYQDVTYFYSDVMIEQTNIENNSNSKITLYPNPASDFITISGIEGTSKIILTNEIGLIVQQSIIDNNILTLENLKSGVYFYTISQNNTTITTGTIIIK